jgi:hypothetical protein
MSILHENEASDRISVDHRGLRAALANQALAETVPMPKFLALRADFGAMPLT